MDEVRLAIVKNKDRFTKSEQEIARYYMDNNEATSLNQLANKLHVSSPTISRFVRKLGFESFEEFNSVYKSSLEPTKEYDRNVMSIRNKHLYNLNRNYETINFDNLDTLVSMLVNRSVLVLATEDTASMCIDLVNRLRRLRIDIKLAKTRREMVVELNLLETKGIVIFVSISGYNKILEKIQSQLLGREVFTFGISASNSDLIKNCDLSSLIYLSKDTLLSTEYSSAISLTILFDYLYIKTLDKVSDSQLKQKNDILKEILEIK